MTFIQLRKAIRTVAWPREIRYLTKGLAATLEHRDILRRIPTVKSVVDIGANRGQFVLEALKWHPSSQIVALEPLSSERKVLSDVASRNKNVAVLPYAAGSVDDSIWMNVTAARDSSSLLRPSTMQVSIFPDSHATHVEKAEVRQLDGIPELAELQPPILCKVDVQGYELEVIRGGHNLLARTGYLIIELSNAALYTGQPNSAEVIKELSTLGFVLYDIYNCCRVDGRCIQADFLFQRISK